MSDILTGFNMQGNDPIDDRIVSKSNLETLEQYLNRVPVQKRYYGLTFFALDKNNELRKYTFQTSLIEPTIDDDKEEIERIDKELQEHVSNKAIHKTSEEIRSEIVDADIPDTIARVQWTLDQINTAVINLIGGASDEYNTLKRIQTKIEELRAKIYGDDGGEVLKTLEQALKFLNQYKDFIVDIPDNFVSKQDIVDNLTTDDPTKVLSAKQGKVLSDTLTNYFESAMQSIRTETDRAINAENRIETKLDKEIDRSIKEDQRIDSKLDSEINRSTAEDDRLDKKIDAETTRATTAESNLNTKIETETDRAEGEESRIEAKLDNEITRSTNKDTEHDNRLQALEGDTHEQNTDLGTTNSTFQLKYNTGNKIKHESDAISVRNAADTDYVNFIAKNATFKGDLLVEGQSFVTEAETVEIKDNLLLLNKGEVGAGVTKGIAGLEIDRGTEPNYQIIFDESDNRFKAGEIGDIQCLALRDGDDSMVNGMFTTWDSTTKRLKTTNIVPSSSFLYFGDNKTVSLNYSSINEGLLRINTNNQHLEIFTGNTYTNFRSTRNKFQFIGDLYSTGTKYALTFKRSSDNSEVLYHADIINDLTTGGTNKVLSAEQGKLLQNSITSIQGSYLPLSGGTMKGSIRFPAESGIIGNADGTGDTYILRSFNNRLDIGSAALSTRIISKASDLLHHRLDTSYKIWDAYNLTNPVTYTTNTYNHATLTNKDGQYFTYIKAGTNGLLPHSKATLVSGGSGSLGTSDQSFNAAYINNLHTNKVTFGDAGPYIIGSTSATQFLNAEGDVQKVATGGLYVGPSYASNALALVPSNGIYSQGNIRTSGWLTFEDNEWTDTGWVYKDAKGSIKVLSVINETNNKPTSYGSVLQFNSRKGHWCTQIWCDQTNAAGVIGTLRFRTTKSYASTEWNPWTALVTTSDLNSYLTKTEASTLYYPYNGRGYFSITSTGIPVMNNNQGYAVKDKDGNVREVLWMGPNNFLYLGNTSQYTLNQLDLRCTTLTHNGNKIATQNYVTNQLSNYLPLTGGTLTGNLTINTVGSTTFVINNNDTNGSETFMRVLRKGTASAAIGFRDSLGAYIYNYNSNKYLFIDNDGYARVGTTSGSTRLALITDIPTVSGYLPLTGGTLTGTLSINSGGSEPLIINNSASAGEAYVVTKTQGTTRGVMGWNSSLGMFLQDNRGYTFSVKADGVYFGASSSTLTKLPTSTDLSNYLPLTGGNLTGKLSIKSSGSNLLILDSSSSTESVIHFLRSSTTKGAVGYYDNIGAFIYNFPSNTYLFVKDDGKPYVGTKTNYKKILTETDITGYATQSWSNSQYPLKTGTGASGTWDINISGNASTASAASKLGSTTIGGSAKPIYLSSGTPTACSATVGSTTVPVYMNAGTITQCSTTLGVSITGNAATATNSTQLGGTAASSYVKANDNISRLTNDSGYTTQEWINGQGFLTSDSILDKFVPTTGGYIRNSDQVLLRLQRTGVSTGTSRTIEMYFDDSNTDGTSTTPRGSIGYNSEVGMFLYSAKSKKFLAMEYTGRPFYGTPENRYYLLGSNTEYHNLDGYQRIGNIMIQWGYFSVQGNSTRAVNFPVSFTNTVWSVTGSWDNTATGSQENWGFTDYTSSGFTIINGDGSSRVFHYIAIGPFTRS